MLTEHLVYERAEAASRLDEAFLVTAVAHDRSRSLIVRESHVFFPGREVHRHEIVFQDASIAPNMEAVVRQARDHTRKLGLFSGASRSWSDRWFPAQGVATVELSRVEECPFHEYLLAGKFRDDLWEIQDWTTSRALRATLARVTSYRFDVAEAALLARIFNGSVPIALSEG